MSEQPEEGPPSYEEAMKSPENSEENSPELLGATSVEKTSCEEKKQEAEKKAEAEYGWRETVDPGIALTSVPMVLPPGLQPLLTLDTLLIRETYERGKGRRYRICNRNGEAVLYSRKTRRGPKDYQLYDSTRTAIVGLWNFSVAADFTLYANLECPPKIPLATIRAEETSSPSDSGNASKQMVKYTICNVLGQPVFTALSPITMDEQETNIKMKFSWVIHKMLYCLDGRLSHHPQGVGFKVYSVSYPEAVVAEFLWNTQHPEANDDSQTIIERNSEGSFEKWVKVTFPLDLEVKMKAALLATCFLKDKIDHRMNTKGGSCFAGTFGSSSRHRPRHKHFMHL